MSMDLPNHLSSMKLNNFVVEMRGKVKQVLVRMSHRMTKEIKKLRDYKADSEEVKKKKTRKASRLVKEMRVMKKLNKDDVAKFAVQFDKKPESVLNDTKAHIKYKVLVKVAMNDIMKKQIEKFRQDYPNWTIEVPNILRNMELKKKGMKLKDDIQKGEGGIAPATKPTPGDSTRNTSKVESKPQKNKKSKKDNSTADISPVKRDTTLKADTLKAKTSQTKTEVKKIDTQNTWLVSTDDPSEEKKSNKGAKHKKQPIDTDSSAEESENDISDSSENDRLAQKLSDALKKIAPGSDEEGETSDDDDDDADITEDEASDYDLEDKKAVLPQKSSNLLKKSSSDEEGSRSNENSDEEDDEDDDDDDSTEDEFEEERRKRKLELINKTSKSKDKSSPTKSKFSSKIDNKKSGDKESVKQGKEKKTDVKSGETKMKGRNTTSKDSDQSEDFVKKKTSEHTVSRRVEKEEMVVDDFFMTKDNREYKSSVKPNPVAEQGGGEGDEDVNRSERRRSLQTNAQPKEIYRKGKKIVLNNNRNGNPRFSNYEKDGDKFGNGGFSGNDRFNKGGYNGNDKFNKGGYNSNDKFNKGGYNSNDKFNKGGYNSNDKFNKGGYNSNDKFNKGGYNGNDRFNKGGYNGNDKFNRNDRFSGGAKNFGGGNHSRFEKGNSAPSGGPGEKLHPSWEAKKRHQPAIAGFQGKKIKFD